MRSEAAALPHPIRCGLKQKLGYGHGLKHQPEAKCRMVWTGVNEPAGNRQIHRRHEVLTRMIFVHALAQGQVLGALSNQRHYSA